MSALSTTARALPTGRTLLRAALKLDAAVTGANGLAYLAAAGPLGDLLGLPPGPLRAIGAVLLAFAGALAVLGSRPAPAASAVKGRGRGQRAVGGRLRGARRARRLVADRRGAAWIVAQAGVVAAFAALQGRGLKNAGR